VDGPAGECEEQEVETMAEPTIRRHSANASAVTDSGEWRRRSAIEYPRPWARRLEQIHESRSTFGALAVSLACDMLSDPSLEWRRHRFHCAQAVNKLEISACEFVVLANAKYQRPNLLSRESVLSGHGLSHDLESVVRGRQAYKKSGGCGCAL